MLNDLSIPILQIIDHLSIHKEQCSSLNGITYLIQRIKVK
jgi:hypothetical protein